MAIYLTKFGVFWSCASHLQNQLAREGAPSPAVPLWQAVVFFEVIAL